MPKAVYCAEDIQSDSMVIGDSRVHPFENYMGEVGDNIIGSLSLEDPMLDALVRQAVVMKWQNHMGGIKKDMEQ